ncbi:MAG: hypothetical protein V1779_16930 [bacterium]
MEEELKSEGSCLFCEKMISQREMGKHLGMHLSEMEKNDGGNGTKNYCHVVVDAGEMFLHLLVNGTAKMKLIDNFLRDIWLDCCGHLSCFGHKNFKISNKDIVEDIFVDRIKIYHDYDFGTTTRTYLKGLKNYQLRLKDDIVLLSRNQPLKLMCVTCKIKPAAFICTTCNYDDYSFFCEECAKKHEETCADFAEYGNMPVVNSPRMGECGYEGGSIDIERDGIYKVK